MPPRKWDRDPAGREADPSPPLGAKALMDQIRGLPFYKGLAKARIAYKKNDKDEHVVAVIWSPEPS